MTMRDSELQEATTFRLDRINQCLWRDGESISLSPKAFAVLSYLADRPGRLVTKQELLDALWGDIHVTEGVLKRAILEIRKAMSDSVEEPRYIQTLHRRGYRLAASLPDKAQAIATVSRRRVVGREAEMAEFDECLECALNGSRQLLFISGEAGLGKTALLEQWTQSLSRQRAAGAKAAVAWGRCLPQSAAAEPYLPVLDALENLGRELGRPFVETLRTHAPALLLQLRGLVPAEERGKIREEASGSTREGMLREITSALEALSRLAPLAIVLEDLQWSDPFTIELLRSIARRTTSARLMILATCRSDEAARLNPQLLEAQSDLELHDQCRTISLAPLSERDAAVFLHVACSGLDFPDRQARDIHRRCGGNPLFMACLSGELARSSKGTGVNDIVPDILRRMFELQATRLSTAEREMLEAAAVAGESFSAGAVAETLNWDPDATESMCETLAGPDAFLKHAPPFFLPDGSERPAYSFRHELCRDALYRLIPTGRRARYHDALGRAGQARRGARLFVVEGVAGVASATRPRTCPAPLAS